MALRLHRGLLLLLLLLLPLLAVLLPLIGCTAMTEEPNAVGPGEYLFCFWNVENLFDDQDDKRTGPGDKEYDPWFAHDAKARQQKFDHLSKAIVAMNDGKGPDILAVAEVESERAAELLREALNSRLHDSTLHYTTVLMKAVSGGRHIAPAILTRLPVERDRTRLLGSRQRILEAHLQVNGHDLVVLASHWTSRVSDEKGEGRAKYADQLYGRYRAMYTSNPDVDLLICGDFNDTPDDASVIKHLHACGDVTAVRSAKEPLLLDLFAGRDPNRYGTHSYKNHWYIFDHIVVAPGMLDDKGWSCEPDSAQAVRTLVDPKDKHQRPWRFGSEHDKGERGYSDHFPVTVRLKVH